MALSRLASPRGVTAVCGTGGDGDAWGLAQLHEGKALCFLAPKRLPNPSNIPLSVLSEPLPSRELCPVLPDVLPGLESGQVLQQDCHDVYPGTLPSLRSERFEPACPRNPCSWQNERTRISSELSRVTAELWEGSV